LPNVNKNGFWEAAVDAVTVSGNNLGLTGRTAILDTGTTLIIAPQADANAVHQAISGAKSDGQGGFTVPCTTNATVAMTFGGASFAIDTRDLAVQPVDPNAPNGDCVSGIAAGNIGGANEWLVCVLCVYCGFVVCLGFVAGWGCVLEERVFLDGRCEEYS
jgi:Eukaryotic aspartyl protease